MLTPAKIRAARALLGLTQARLAAAVGISKTALCAIETGGSDPRSSTLKAIRAALESRGVVFTPDGVAQRMEWRDPAPDAATKRRIISGLNDARRAQNRAMLIDDEDGP